MFLGLYIKMHSNYLNKNAQSIGESVYKGQSVKIIQIKNKENNTQNSSSL